MNLTRRIHLLLLALALTPTHYLFSDPGVVASKLVMDYRSFDFFPEASLGLRTDLSWTQSGNWGARGTAYGLRRYGVAAFQGALGATYWLTPNWSVDLDADAATNASILPMFSGTAATSVTISKTATPSFTYQYAYYDDASSHTLTPALSWAVVPEVELSCKLNGSLSRYLSGKTAGTISGSARVTFAPYDYFSIFTGLSIGEQPFEEPGLNQPLSSYFSQKLSGGIKFVVDGSFGAEVNLDRDWRNNGKNVFAAEFASFYRW